MIALALALMLDAAPAAAVPADIGPQPTMEEYIALAEPALDAKRKGRRPVTYEWPYRLVAGSAGYYTCGRVDRAKTKGRGSEGIWVSARVAQGRVVDAQWSTMNGMLAWLCKREIKKGTLVAR